jgi:hypothetical protein
MTRRYHYGMSQSIDPLELLSRYSYTHNTYDAAGGGKLLAAKSNSIQTKR